MKVLITALVLFQAWRISPAKYYETSRTIEMEKGRVSKQSVDIDIQSHIPGWVKWTVTDRDTFQIEVKLKALNPTVFEEVDLDFLYEWKSMWLFLSYHNPQAITDFKNGGLCHQYGICCLLLSLVVFSFTHGGKVSVVCSFIICFLVLVNGFRQEYVTAEIQINSPRNQSYNNIDIFITGGRIRIDHDLTRANASQLSCSTILESDKGCSSCCHGHGVCQENRCLCDDDWEDEISCQTETSVINTLLINPSDSRLTESHYSNGDTLTAFGKRQFSGNPKSVDILKHRKPNRADITVYFDDEHRMKKIYSSNGDIISMKWRNDCRVYVTALTSTRKYQANTDVRICDQTTERTHDYAGATKSSILNLLPRKHRASRVERDSLNKSSNSIPGGRGTFHWPFVHVPIFVSRCGKSENLAEVYVLSESENDYGEWVTPVEYHAVESGTPGLFYIKIPNKPAMRAKHILENSCPTIGPPVMKTCSTVSSTFEEQQNKICEATENTFQYVQGASHSEINDIIRTCKAGFQTVVRYCKTMDFTPFTTDSECETKFNKTLDVYTNTPLLLTPVALFAGGHLVRGPSVIVNVSESMVFLPKVLDVQDERPHLEITDVAVSPNDPAPLERYDVSTDYVCGTPTTDIDMRIVGSDGYRNSMDCNGISNCSCCVLNVAGAAELVVDDIKVSVSDPRTNYNFTRQIIVIF